jgi:hypothetical protein
MIEINMILIRISPAIICISNWYWFIILSMVLIDHLIINKIIKKTKTTNIKSKKK